MSRVPLSRAHNLRANNDRLELSLPYTRIFLHIFLFLKDSMTKLTIRMTFEEKKTPRPSSDNN